VTVPTLDAQLLITALKAALNTAGVALGDGVKPSTTSSRYIVAWFDAGTVDDSSLRSRDGFTMVGTFHCYGTTPEAARFAYRALTGAVLSLAGQTLGSRVVWMPEQLTSLPLQRDDNLSPALFDAVCEWRFRTTPA
jgi:hypothetical protein